MAATRARKNFKEDQLVTATVRASEWAQEHFNQVIIGIVALVAAVAVVVFVANNRASTAEQNERQMGQALTMMQAGDLNAARGTFEQLAARAGGDYGVRARFFKAECELRLGNFAQAVADYDAYLARKSDYAMFAAAAQIGKGTAYEGLRQWPEAAEAMAGAVPLLEKEDPRYHDAAFRAGSFYLDAGNHAEALKYFEIAADGSSGELKSRADVAVTSLK